jgi:hypothetical protein
VIPLIRRDDKSVLACNQLVGVIESRHVRTAYLITKPEHDSNPRCEDVMELALLTG